ncbi:MAG TPA: DUF3105 domain-containing protein [Vicinamibacteria bacterium]|nr:DUF3105 domain-containing protein [Vicinamibacteria bacterium]
MRSRRLPAALVLLLSACGGGDPPTLPDPGTCAMSEEAVPNEGWAHVAEGSAVTYAANPPASGPHYPVWLRYELFTSPLARGYWVHNLEHGAIVLLHRPDAPGEVVEALRSVYRALPDDPACGHSRAVLTPDPLLDTPVAVVAADFVLSGSCVSPNSITQFVTTHRARAPENVCGGGSRP